MLRLAIFFFCLLLLPARANLGEAVEQCVARYGRPIGYSEATPKFPFGSVAFTATGYTLVIFVLNNKEVGARVTKTDKSAFTDAEMQTILAADSAPGAWASKPSSDPTSLEWARADKATALYDKDKHIVVFTSDAMSAALRAGIPVPVTPAPAPAPATAQAPAH